MNKQIATTQMVQATVERPRLTEKLHEDVRKYTLVLLGSIAGSGKTTLLEQWTNYEQMSEDPSFMTSWIRFSRSSDTPETFWAQLNEAFESMIPSFNEELQNFLHPSKQSSVKILGAQSARKFNTRVSASRLDPNCHYVAILDNFQFIKNEETLEGLAHLMEYVPQNVHFIISSRSSNPLPLVRLKIRNQVSTITMQDLKFNNKEVLGFFYLRNKTKLSLKEIDLIQDQFEGWVAGMQAFCLSPQSKTITANVVRAFYRNNRNYLEYITSEVLKGLTDEELEFLIKTSILDSFNVALCNNIMERKDSRFLINNLLDYGLIEIKFISESTCFRCPRFLKQVFNVFFDEIYPELKNSFSKKASEFYEAEGVTTRAIKYALKSQDNNRVIKLIEKDFWLLFKGNRFLTLNHRISKMPRDIIESNLYLLLISAYGNLFFNQTDDAIPAMDAIREMIKSRKNTNPEPDDQRLDSMVHTFDALLYSQTGEIDKCIESAEKVLSQKDEGVSLLRCMASMAMGNGLARSQSPEQSISTLKRAGLSARAGQYLDTTALTTYHIAHEYLRQGQLSKAKEELERTVELIKDSGKDELFHYAGVLLAPLGEIELERNNLKVAGEYFSKSQNDMQKLESLEYLCDCSVSFSRWKFAEQKYRESIDVLEDALIIAHNFKNARAIALLDAHITVLHSKLGYHALAQGWADDFDYNTPQSDLPRKEVEHLSYSHILIDMQRYDEAHQVLDQLLTQAKSTQHVSISIQAYLQKSIAYYQMSMIKEAYSTFDQVIRLAKTEFYIRTIIDENNIIPEFLLEYSSFKSFPKNSAEQKYLNMLMEVSAAEATEAPCPARIMKLLSKRELEVYLLLQQGYTNKQIASQLFISLETVKSHRKSINRKLEAGTRDEIEEKQEG